MSNEVFKACSVGYCDQLTQLPGYYVQDSYINLTWYQNLEGALVQAEGAEEPYVVMSVYPRMDYSKPTYQVAVRDDIQNPDNLKMYYDISIITHGGVAEAMLSTIFTVSMHPNISPDVEKIPSINAEYVGAGRGGKRLTAHGKKFKQLIKDQIEDQGFEDMLELVTGNPKNHRWILDLAFEYDSMNGRRDNTNMIKMTEDAIFDFLELNDSRNLSTRCREFRIAKEDPEVNYSTPFVAGDHEKIHIRLRPVNWN